MLNRLLNELREMAYGESDGVYGSKKCLYSIKNKRLYRVIFDTGIMFEDAGDKFIPYDVPKKLTKKQAIAYINKD